MAPLLAFMACHYIITNIRWVHCRVYTYQGPHTLCACVARLVHRQTMAELRGTASYQRKLLDAAVQLVKPGGTLVFSTCTINPGVCAPLTGCQAWQLSR